jgi:hypothetical protein
MPTCYVITRGSSADYEVCAVYTTRAKAEQNIRVYGQDAEIEEYSLDHDFPQCPAGMRGYKVIEAPSGKLDSLLWTEDEMRREYVGAVEVLNDWRTDSTGKRLKIHIWAADESHAIKIASEKFAQYRAIQAGVA